MAELYSGIISVGTRHCSNKSSTTSVMVAYHVPEGQLKRTSKR